MNRFSKILLVPLFILFSLAFVSAQAVSAETLGEIILEPGASSSSSFTVTVYEDSGSEMVNAVQANLTFPAGLKATVNTTGSPFDIAAEKKIESGSVQIASGTVTPVSGRQKVATVTFTGAGNPSDATVSDDSAIIRSSDSKNIYAKSQNYYAEESVLTSQTDALDATNSAQSIEKKGFFAKIVAWNNSLWDKIVGLFSKDK